jgi:lysophospholipase L1-like esterase
VIDHYAFWHKRLDDGGDVQDWTTDGYHANPRGHREMAAIMQSVIVEALKSK